MYYWGVFFIWWIIISSNSDKLHFSPKIIMFNEYILLRCIICLSLLKTSFLTPYLFSEECSRGHSTSVLWLKFSKFVYSSQLEVWRERSISMFKYLLIELIFSSILLLWTYAWSNYVTNVYGRSGNLATRLGTPSPSEFPPRILIYHLSPLSPNPSR